MDMQKNTNNIIKVAKSVKNLLKGIENNKNVC